MMYYGRNLIYIKFFYCELFILFKLFRNYQKKNRKLLICNEYCWKYAKILNRFAVNVYENIP